MKLVIAGCLALVSLPGALIAQEPAAQPGRGAWANYDFVPGNRILFADDYAADRVGNFPRRLELGAGSMELVEWQGRRLVRSNDNGFFIINLPEVLPRRFTLEADIIPGAGAAAGPPVIAFDGPQQASETGQIAQWLGEQNRGLVQITRDRAGVVTTDRDNQTALAEELAGQLVHLRVMADGNYVKVYVNETRVANVPNIDLGRSRRIIVGLNASADEPAFIGSIRVAASDLDLYEALSGTGRIAVQGIYFDTGSDRLRPESSGTLRQIADMLGAHQDLRLMIEGHTDNVGEAAANRALSERRAAAVLQALAGQYGISTSRLSSSGLGDTRPAAPNTTAEGRQQNRRVELVRM